MSGTRLSTVAVALCLLLSAGCREKAAQTKRSDKPRDAILNYEMVTTDGGQCDADAVIRVLRARLNDQDNADVDLEAVGTAIEARLPADRAEDVKKLLERSSGLELRLAIDYRLGPKDKPLLDRQELERLSLALQQGGPDGAFAGSPFRWYPLAAGAEPDNMRGLEMAQWDGRTYILLGNTSQTAMRSSQSWRVVDARQGYDDRTGGLAIDFALDDKGSELLGRLTGDHIDQHLAILVGGEVYSAPRVLSRIEGRGQITGRFTKADAQEMVRCLKAGTLGCELRLTSQRRVLFDNTGGRCEDAAEGSCVAFRTQSKLTGEGIIALVDGAARKMNPPVKELFADQLRLTIHENCLTELLEVELFSGCTDEVVLRRVMGDALGSEIQDRRQALQFDGVGMPPDDARILRIDDSFINQWSVAIARTTMEDFMGGTAVIMEAVSPAQTLDELAQRLYDCRHPSLLEDDAFEVVDVRKSPRPGEPSNRFMVLLKNLGTHDAWDFVSSAAQADEGFSLTVYTND